MDAREQRRQAELNAAKQAEERRLAQESARRSELINEQYRRRKAAEQRQAYQRDVQKTVTEALQASDSFDTSVTAAKIINGIDLRVQREVVREEADRLRGLGFRVEIDESTQHKYRVTSVGGLSGHGGSGVSYDETKIELNISSKDA